MKNSTELIAMCKESYEGFIAEQKRNGLLWVDNDINFELFSTGWMQGYFEDRETRLVTKSLSILNDKSYKISETTYQVQFSSEMKSEIENALGK